MIFKKKNSSKITKTKEPTTQNTIKFETLDEQGYMNITKNWCSLSYSLGDIEYLTAKNEDKIIIIDNYADCLNLLEGGTKYQLLVKTKKITEDKLEDVKYKLQNDKYDVYRQEYNKLIENRFKNNNKAFEVEKFITISIDGIDENQTKRQLQDITKDLTSHFNGLDISLKKLNGVERLKLFDEILNENSNFNHTYEDIKQSKIGVKSFIAPSRIEIKENFLKINEGYAQVLYIKHFPKSLNDKLIKNLTNLSFELTVTVNAEIYEEDKIRKELEDIETSSYINLVKSQKKASRDGVFVSDEFIGGDMDKKTVKNIKRWKEEMDEYDQKIFKGLIAVYFKAKTKEELKNNELQIKRVGNKLGVRFETVYYYQEEALNTILPIGYNYLDVEQCFSRNMTSSNIAIQVPFTQVDLISNNQKAMYYGQNQLSHNMITVNRKRDLLTGSGIITGISGSGKSMTVKTNEIIPNRLRYPEDEIIIVDPEDEYSDIGKKFNAQIIDISTGSDTYINVLDLPDIENLLEADKRKVIENKSNLLINLFEDVLEEIDDKQITIIDRVTRQTYKFFENPTLKELHKVLLNQKEEEAKELALQLEIYTVGSQSIFSQKTNVNLDNKFIVFNLNNLSGKLKPLALSVIQDFIWNKVVKNRGKIDSWIYFDELQLYFRSQKQATFFTELYSRVRKYGAIPTGITQNVETVYNIEEGRKLLSNSEFMIILKQKNQDLKVWEKIISLTDEQIKYIKNPKEKGTGLIYAGGVVVPFENPIPRESKLFALAETDSF